MVDTRPILEFIKSLINYQEQFSSLKAQIDDLTQKLQAEQSAHQSDAQNLQQKIAELQQQLSVDEQQLQELAALVPSNPTATAPA